MAVIQSIILIGRSKKPAHCLGMNHILYMRNSQIKDDTVLGRLMHDFSCTKADDMIYPILANRVRYFKEDAKGVAIMCKVMEDMRNEAGVKQRVKRLGLNSIETASRVAYIGESCPMKEIASRPFGS